MLKELRTFVLRGNLVELAVTVVIGTAFATVVTAFVKGLVTPLIAAVGGEPDFARLAFEINGSRFAYGEFPTAPMSSARQDASGAPPSPAGLLTCPGPHPGSRRWAPIRAQCLRLLSGRGLARDRRRPCRAHGCPTWPGLG